MKPYISKAEDLDVYQAAYTLSLEIHKTSLNFPKIEQYALADQLRRSSKSICANLSEGYARQSASSAEFKRFIIIAIGSCNESITWCHYAKDLEYISKEQYDNWTSTFNIVMKMLIKLRNSIATV